MMKKVTWSLALLLAGGLALPAITSAEAVAAPANSFRTKEVKELKDMRQDYRADRQKTYLDQVVERLNLAVSQIQTLSERVDKFLTTQEATGKDLTAVRAKQAEASTALTAAQTAISAVASLTMPAKPTKANLLEIRTKVKAATDALRLAHNKLMEVLKATRQALAPVKSGGTAGPKTPTSEMPTSAGTPQLINN